MTPAAAMPIGIENRPAELERFITLLNKAEDSIFYSFGETDSIRISNDLAVRIEVWPMSATVVMKLDCDAPRHGTPVTTLQLMVTSASWRLEAGAPCYTPQAVRLGFIEAWSRPKAEVPMHLRSRHALEGAQGRDMTEIRAWANEIVASQGTPPPLNV